jgi:hypothetical protein
MSLLCYTVKHFLYVLPIVLVWRRATSQTGAFATVANRTHPCVMESRTGTAIVASHKATKPMAISNSYSLIPLLQLMHCLKIYGRNFSCFFARWALVADKHFCVPKCCYQSVYCYLIRYFLVRIRNAKCFANSSKRFLCVVMFENEHTFCSWIHHICTCSFCATGVIRGLATKVTLTRVSRRRWGWTCFWFRFWLQCVIVFGLCFKLYTLHLLINRKDNMYRQCT